jgi:RNA polymerase sigma-70 factor, ECF subfamily
MQSCADLAVEAAFTEHGPALVRYLTWLTRDREVAQDLAQESFLRLAGELRAGRAPDSTAAWLRRVATNLATSRARRVQVAARHEMDLPRPTEPRSPESIVVSGELASQVGVLVCELSTTEQRAVLLAAHGADGAEIARAVGRTPAATRTLLCRARAKLRQRMMLAGYATA